MYLINYCIVTIYFFLNETTSIKVQIDSREHFNFCLFCSKKIKFVDFGIKTKKAKLKNEMSPPKKFNWHIKFYFSNTKLFFQLIANTCSKTKLIGTKRTCFLIYLKKFPRKIL